MKCVVDGKDGNIISEYQVIVSDVPEYVIACMKAPERENQLRSKLV